MMAGPFLLRAGAPQLLAAGLEKGGEIRVLGGVELLGREGDKIWRCNLPFYVI